MRLVNGEITPDDIALGVGLVELPKLHVEISDACCVNFLVDELMEVFLAEIFEIFDYSAVGEDEEAGPCVPKGFFLKELLDLLLKVDDLTFVVVLRVDELAIKIKAATTASNPHHSPIGRVLPVLSSDVFVLLHHVL